MAVSREPISKRCRNLGISPTVLGYTSKKQSNRFRNVQSRKKISEYGLQLKEKQKLKFIYGVLEKQFYHYYELAAKQQGVTGENLMRFLETRLDSVVFRFNFAITRREARQLVNHGHFLVNGKRVDIPSYLVKPGDIISVVEKSKKSTKFAAIKQSNSGKTTPLWATVNSEELTGTVNRYPQRDELDFEISEHLVVELYSK